MADQKRQLNVPLDPQLAEAVHRAAHRACRSKASWVRDVLRRAIVDADRRPKHGLLSWTKIHGGSACHEALLPELRKALAETPVSKAAKRVRMPRVLLRHKL
jgi:hypothetical protein